MLEGKRVLFLGFYVVLTAFCEQSCPNRPILSGITYVRTDATSKAASEWKLQKEHDMRSLMFVPTIIPKEKNDILPLSEKKIEAELKLKQAYNKAHLTNDLDFRIRNELDEIDAVLGSHPSKAYNKYQQLYADYKSPRALFGLAVALNKLAEKKLSKGKHHDALKLQGKAATKFCQVLALENVPLFLFLMAGRACISLRRARHENERLITSLILMKAKFPNALEYASDLAVAYIRNRQFRKAITELEYVTKRWPDKSAKEAALLGFALKWAKENNLATVQVDDSRPRLLFEKSLKSSSFKTVTECIKEIADHFNEQGVIKEASFFLQTGAELGLFMSKWQRAPFDDNFFLPGLTAKPIWRLEELNETGTQLKAVAKNWAVIREEALKSIFGSNKDYNEEANNLRSEGLWQQLVLYENGHDVGCSEAPKTCAIVNKFLKETAIDCKRGQVKFSVLQPGSHVKAHSGPTNTRLRAHLGLVVPREGESKIKMRIADKFINWSEGQVFVIDDSFEHEVWHQANGIRLVLLIDFWHPDLSNALKKRLSTLPTKTAADRTTVFHIGGIVSDLADTLTSSHDKLKSAIVNVNNAK